MDEVSELEGLPRPPFLDRITPLQWVAVDVVLAGQNPAGLTQAVAAVSTPGSPQYRRYLTSAQYAASRSTCWGC